MKKLLTTLLTVLMLFTLIGCNSNKGIEEKPVIVDTPEELQEVDIQEEPIVGSYVDVEDKTITPELNGIFTTAMQGLLGASYEPLELVATQVVSGTNYKFLAKGSKTTNPITIGTYYIYINEDLNGNISLLDIEVIEEKQQEQTITTSDPSKYSYWVVFYDSNNNELQRTIESYGTTPSYKEALPVGFISWDKELKPITTNTYIKAICNVQSNSSELKPGLYIDGEFIELSVEDCGSDGSKIKDLITEPNTELVIPSGVTSICSSAFKNCELLSSVVIPDTVISIGGCAFEMCSNLKSITIPASVTSIGGWVLSGVDATVNYDGTKEDFLGIVSSLWFENSKYITINCTDGTMYYDSTGDITAKVECEKQLSEMTGAEIKIDKQEAYLTVKSMKYSSGKTISVPYSLGGGNYYISTIESMSFPSEVEEIYFQQGLGKLGNNGTSILSNINHQVKVYLPYITYLGPWTFENCSDIVISYPGTHEEFMSMLGNSGYESGEIKNFLGAYKVVVDCSNGSIVSPFE